jgi:flagellar protein FlaG
MKVTTLPVEMGPTGDSGPLSKFRQHLKAESAKAKNPSPVQSPATPSQVAPPVVNGLGLGLQFYLDKETGRSVIRVLDVESGKVVRQIPSEEVLNFLRELEKRQGPVISLKL